MSIDRPTPASDKLAGLGFSVLPTTASRLEQYTEMLTRWNTHINLVASSTTQALWQRHILDALQLLCLLPARPNLAVLDIGSGGGLPGIVMACLPLLHVKLVESDKRKAAFLQQVVSTLQLNASVVPKRIESIAPFDADVITSRACAPLDDLLALAYPFFSGETIGLFHKGKSWRDEHENACKNWSYGINISPSLTQPDAVVLRIVSLTPR